jgi:ABC-type nitrate/sulfonate/bicarbonate transport system substrate-binding protein
MKIGMKIRRRSLMLLMLPLVGLAGTASAQESLTKLTVGLGDVSLTKLIFVVAADAGIYKKNGLDVAQYIDPYAAETVARSGVQVPKEFVRRADGDDVAINIGGGSYLMYSATTNAKTTDRVILGTTDAVSRYHIMSRNEITDPSQLKGKRIGYTSEGSLTHMMILMYARKMGWDPLWDISMMANGTGVEPMKRGRVDASAADEVARVNLAKAGYRDLVDLNQFNIPMAGSGINAERNWLKNNRDTAARFMKAAVEAIALVKSDRQAAFASLAKWYGISDPQKQEEIYKDIVKLPAKPYPAVEGIKTAMQVYDSHEMRSHKPEDFFDASFVGELDKSGFIEGLYKKTTASEGKPE